MFNSFAGRCILHSCLFRAHCVIYVWTEYETYRQVHVSKPFLLLVDDHFQWFVIKCLSQAKILHCNICKTRGPKCFDISVWIVGTVIRYKLKQFLGKYDIRKHKDAHLWTDSCSPLLFPHNSEGKSLTYPSALLRWTHWGLLHTFCGF